MTQKNRGTKSLSEVLTETRNIVTKLSDLVDHENVLVQNSFKSLHSIYWDYVEYRKSVAEEMVKYGCVMFISRAMQYYQKVGFFKNDNVWFATYYIVSTLWNFTDCSVKLSMELCEKGFVKMLTNVIKNPPKCSSQKNSDYLLKSSLSILQNMSKIPENRFHYDECQTATAMKPYLNHSDPFYQAVSVMAYTAIIDEEQAKSLSDTGTIKFMVTCIKNAIENKEKRRYRGFTPLELVEGLNRMAINDSNKIKIVNAGALPLFVQMMNYTDTEEQSIAARTLWTLSFDSSVRDRIQAENNCVPTLNKLSQSPNPQVKKNANGCLWQLKGESRRTTVKTENKSSADGDHIMISYQWDHQETVIRVAESLKNDGFKVWLDVDQMGGSTLDAMATAVEKAKLVIIGLSEQYKQSPNCRSEADYTYQLKKPIVPLMMQQRYKPDGWLGMIVGTKFYINFDGKYTFDKAYQMLKKEISTQTGVAAPIQKDTVDGLGAVPKAPSSSSSPGASTWNKAKVAEWLDSSGLSSLKTKMKDYDGALLAGLIKCKTEAPEFFYQSLKGQLNLDLQETLKLSEAMEKLRL